MHASDLQRLQRLFAYFKKNTSKMLEGCCALVELIDEDDLTNWYVLLKYEDENNKEFFVSLRIYFFEELQRMPLVFVIAPRLVATFIHHGAICSLELMSQQWSVDAEGIALLIRSLHATLNPFSHDSKVTVDELNSSISSGNQQHQLPAADAMDVAAAPAVPVAAYTQNEHELGIQHIRQSHPHLFRGCSRKDFFKQQQQQRQQEDLLAAAFMKNGVVVPNSSAASSTSYAYDDGRGMASVKKATIHSGDELQKLFFAGGVMDVQLDLGGQDLPNGGRCESVDEHLVKCTLPTAGFATPSYTMTIAPCRVEKKEEAKNLHIALDTPTATSDVGLMVPDTDLSRNGEAADCRRRVDQQLSITSSVDGDDMVWEIKPERRRKHQGNKNIHPRLQLDQGKKESGVVLILTGEVVRATNNSDILPSVQRRRKPEAPCTVPVGCTLRLENLTVYGAITVLGTLEMSECTFIGYFSTEGGGRVGISQCNVYVDCAETRREGILVLDASTVEIRNNTTVQRREYTFENEKETPSISPVAPFVLQSLILVSNSGTLHMQGGCRIMSHSTEKTIFAEQDASVDIADCSIMAGSSSAVSILGCRAFFANTRFYGEDSVELQVSDINRLTGLNVELGGLVTARHCVAEHLYFGFSVIAHSVSHFFGCHAEHVVNGYTIDASSVTIENSSAHTNHVGVFVLNKAKCIINNDNEHVLPFEERCRLLLKARENVGRPRKFQRGDRRICKEDPETDIAFSSVFSSPTAPPQPHAATASEDEAMDLSALEVIEPIGMNRKPFDPHPVSGATTTNTSIFPLSFKGGLFSLEVRDACMVAKGMLLADAQDTSIYVYDQGSLTLTDVVVCKSLALSQQPCGVKVVNSRAYVQRCVVADYAFGFAAIQGSSARFEECMAVGGTNGFTVDDAHCTLHHCGATTDHVGVFALNRSTLRMDNLNAAKCKAGWLSCVLKGHLHGLESRSSDTVCIGVTVQHGLDSGFTCYNGGCLRLEKCTVDMGATASSESNIGETSCRKCFSSGIGRSSFISASDTDAADRTDEGWNRGRMGNVSAVNLAHADNSGNLPSYSSQKNSGVKAWSGSRCIAIGCEVRHVTFGYAAIGPDTELEASHCTAKHIVNGFTVDGAKCRLSRCSTNSNHVGVFVLSHGTCKVRRGSYTARMYSIENRNGIVHIEGHVKLSGFSRIGLYVYDGARLDTLTDSMLDIKVCKDPAQQQLPPESTLSGSSATPSGLFPSCFAIDKGTAVIHNAFFGGGAQCAVSCGDGANVYLHQCTAEFCNVAFNALSGSQMYLSNCYARHVRHHALIVHRGGVSRVNCHSPVSSTSGVLHGRLQIEGKCFLERVVLHPTSDVDDEQAVAFRPSLPPPSSSSADLASPRSLPCMPTLSSTSSLLKPNGLIRVFWSGALVMDCCLVLLEDQHRVVEEEAGGKENMEKYVIVAEGRRATVHLRNVLFRKVFATVPGCVGSCNASTSSHGSGLLPKNRHGSNAPCDRPTWYGLVLLQGAKGDIRGLSEASLIGGDASSISGATLKRSLGTSQPLTHYPPTTCVEEGTDRIPLVDNYDSLVDDDSLAQNVKKGPNALSGGEVVPLRVCMTRTSSLVTEHVNVRQLIASGGSTIDASHCYFAGAEAVILSGGSILRAVESRFIGAVCGPAMRVEYATVHLNKCRGYSIRREVIVAKSATLKLAESVFFLFNSESNAASGGAFATGERWFEFSSENSEDGDRRKGEDLLILHHQGHRRSGSGDDNNGENAVSASTKQADTTMSKTAAPTCLPLENTPIEHCMVVPLKSPLLSLACVEETRSDTLLQDAKCRQKHEDCEVDRLPVAVWSVQSKSFQEKCTTEGRVGRLTCRTGESTGSFIRRKAGSCVTEVSLAHVESGAGQSCGGGHHFAVRLERSSLYCCGATSIEGGITADAFSRIEACRTPWFSHIVRVARTVFSTVFGT
ncbi:hypothetical protein TraAM80_09538 [Trypanosoma rangeli]|uniref:Right handed beta helix domain-containing protein n=1 Tax=Trypanosoma rangeli TaxID=5698 RepID=A0A3R7KAW7_TRYRA|nr:uncharacterized protein TraAM80_09538 [Trypanosoma rangeli]RNE97014.1 hypothetical protein TraAM80_09538 [Trypanosoma rangeli]|eukprot:RNE97014.1 hypothetical protein TraAM80_09538 [Trypanosoma rangeli]